MNNSIMYYELYNVEAYTVKHKKTEMQKMGKMSKRKSAKKGETTRINKEG